MDGGRIALELRLASALVQPAVLRSCELQLQAGLRLEASCVHQAGLLPLTVPPQGSARLLFFIGCALKLPACSSSRSPLLTTPLLPQGLPPHVLP